MTAASVTPPDELRRTRRAVFGGAFGFFVDMFDVYLPTVALAPAINYFTPADMPASTKSIVTALIFVATLLGRPVGSAIFGPLADKVGRRRVTLWAVAGCGVCTLLIAVLPGYHQAGLTGVVLMIALRLIDGVFMGGEYTGATPLAMEASPNGRRGWYGGIVGAGFAFAYCAIALVTLLVLQFAPEGSPTSAYSVWGWRIPFVVGAVLCGVFLWWYARQVDESDAWKATKKVRNPVREVIVGRSGRDYLQVFIMMTGVWFASNMASGLLPSALKSEAHVSATEVTGAIVIAQAIHTVLFPFLGEWSERAGRRVFLAWNGVAVGVVCALAYASLAAGWWSGFGLVLVVTVVIRLSGGSMFAITPSYLSERFPAALRGTGFGLGYSGPLLITSFYAYYQDWLGHLMPSAYTPVVLLVLGGIFMVTGALMGPETRQVDFTADARDWPETDGSAGVDAAGVA